MRNPILPVIVSILMVGAAAKAQASTVAEVMAAEAAAVAAKEEAKAKAKGLSKREKAELAVLKAQAKLAKIDAK